MVCRARHGFMNTRLTGAISLPGPWGRRVSLEEMQGFWGKADHKTPAVPDHLHHSPEGGSGYRVRSCSRSYHWAKCPLNSNCFIKTCIWIHCKSLWINNRLNGRINSGKQPTKKYNLRQLTSQTQCSPPPSPHTQTHTNTLNESSMIPD